jgi:transposase
MRCTFIFNSDMVNYCELTDFEKGRLIGLMEAGKSLYSVAQILQRDKKTIRLWWRRWQSTGNVEKLPGRGRKSTCSPRLDRALKNAIKRNRFSTYASIWHQNPSFQTVTQRTLRHRALQLGYISARPVRCIPLTMSHREQRLQWCSERASWQIGDWSNIVFSDESRFCLDMSDGRIRVHRLVTERYLDECIMEKDRYGGGSIMVWGAMSSSGLSRLFIVRGTMRAQDYIDQILEPEAIPFTLNAPNQIFQQDNARPHTAKITQKYLSDNFMPLLPWPARSPDLSLIEHIWDVIGRKLRTEYHQPPTSLQALEVRVVEQWNAIPLQMVQELYDSMPRRIEQCILKRGGHTQY